MKPFSKAILRVPQFPMEATLEDSWDALFQSIKHSSPEFYHLIQGLSYSEFPQQPEHIKRTMLKYFNRAKYRCTPYGSFAAVGIVDIVHSGGSDNMLEKERVLHELINWPEIASLSNEAEIERLQLFANSTYYTADRFIRYVKRVGEAFELSEIGYDPIINKILQALQYPRFYKELIKIIPEAESYIRPLIDCGLIITEKEPNMIGTDYFSRIGYKPAQKIKYQISEVVDPDLQVPASYFRNIPDLINILKSSLIGSSINPNMVSFIERYNRRFDRQTIPLMVAIDPDIGVGYGNFYNNSVSNIIQELQLEEEAKLENPVEQYLRSALEKVGIDETIRLDDLKGLPVDPQGPTLANSVALFCTLNEGKLYFDRIGGHSFTQLAGRFTLTCDGIRDLCQRVTQIEEESNPDVLFFDISYNAELNVDNVNRRAKLYNQELNILNFPGRDKPITIDDLFITISGSEVILRSKRLGKRLIPRMASAYNYRRAKLPVFRFLYDLSFHGLIGDLSFNFPALVTGRKYYPQVEFRNIILSLPKLKISKSEIIIKDSRNPTEILKDHVTQYGIGPIVKIPRNEESIVFDLNCSIQGAMLVQEIVKAGSVFLENVKITQNPLIRDKDNNAFNNQFSIPLVHTNELYKESSPIDLAYGGKRLFLPFKDWLYLEIYCSPAQSDNIILGIQQVLNKEISSIKKWFFIRYNENGNHIRFRVQVPDEYRLSFLDLLYNSLEPKINSGVISNISINAYNREMERYGIAGIEVVEQHFHLDSNLVIQMIQAGRDDLLKYCHCIRLFNHIKCCSPIGQERWSQWMSHVRHMFEKEHGLKTDQFRKIRQYFQEHKELILESLDLIDQNEIDFSLSLSDILNRCPDRRQAPMLTDLMHMHINRLFSDFQRSHELVVFSLLDLVEKNLKYNTKNYSHQKSMLQ
ncbi:lantibiotic dehydratase [Sphingobacterium sp. BIGb0116]|uniref:lantibiotic dehydratase n=1 Tax=Sphingobacterium sp. BIGb0116 TaxID=2940619 RepID=UPI002169D6B1|nr:lantibiotic dehydratase [Sphingobacterium sp. BIGb0116]MCS4165180.1 thiopeptide-type bacteriocin biosynthesis protein [Sphingobacterium sp. BIGb0116]